MPRVHLGPLETIVNVSWPSQKDIGVIALEYHWTKQAHPTFTLMQLPFTGVTFDLAGLTVQYFDPTKPVPAIVNPVSPEMLAVAYMWNAPPFKQATPGLEGGATGRALVFLNLPKSFAELRTPQAQPPLTFRVSCPSASSHAVSGTIYWMWSSMFASSFEENLANPFTTGDPFGGPYAVMTIPAAFGTPEQRAQYLAVMGPLYHPHDEPVSDTVRDGLSYSIDLFTYHERLDFPVSSECLPEWDLLAPPEFRGATSAGASQGQADSLPAKTFEFSIQPLTLICAAQQV